MDYKVYLHDSTGAPYGNRKGYSTIGRPQTYVHLSEWPLPTKAFLVVRRRKQQVWAVGKPWPERMCRAAWWGIISGTAGWESEETR